MHAPDASSDARILEETDDRIVVETTASAIQLPNQQPSAGEAVRRLQPEQKIHL